ncbi:MAG: hypothetical protein NC336_05710 [Clostridium sp.]|nr:hypothetical protein [Clostridium sp.]
MKRIFLMFLPLLMLLFAPAASAQSDGHGKGDRQRWMKEMRQYKMEYLTRQLELTDDQRQEFSTLYQQMDTEIDNANRDTRRMVRDVEKKGSSATALEQEKAAEAMFELKGKEGEIEMKYFPKFKKILKPAQLLKLKKAEQDFTRELMKHNREKKGQKK